MRTIQIGQKRNWRPNALATLAVAAGLVLAGTAGAGQAPAYTAPRTADGRPDLNGFWQAMNEAHWDLEGHVAAPGPLMEAGAAFVIPPGLGVVEDGPIPYQAWAAAKKQEHFKNWLALDPEVKCFLPGVPRIMYMPYPTQFIQSQQIIMMVSQYAGALRTIYMDNHMESPADTWMGWSNGHWDGETLVIETTGFVGVDTLNRIDTRWLDRAGNFFTEALRVVERITRIGPDHLHYEATIDDPKVYTRPWKISMPLYRRLEDNMQILELRCVEFVEDLMYGRSLTEANPLNSEREGVR